MWIELTKEATQAMGAELREFGLTDDQQRWSRTFSLDLSNLTRAKAQKFRDLLSRYQHLKAIKARLADTDRWFQILDGERVRCKKIRDFDSMLKQYLKIAPRHWIYLREGDFHRAYYVSNIQYHPPRFRDGVQVEEAKVVATLNWEELGLQEKGYLVFRQDDVRDLTVGRALAEKGYSVETPELREEYVALRDKYLLYHDKVGLQFTAVGEAEEETERKKYWWNRTQTIVLDRGGVPSRVVVDVLSEDDDKRDPGHAPSASFWGPESCDHEGSPDDDDKDIGPGDEDEEVASEAADVPLQPSLMCFDLRRHTRLKIHVGQMTLYEYRTDLAEKLILPKEVRDLVDMLVSHRGGFQDIVGGKGGGAVVLCAGPPGTGKTLTSEVYSEAMCRPLYSVQCSQLGTDPGDLEKELLKVFARAARWGAILLLDEADVYVAARGSDLTQNAIVGVFLRVLEYYAGILFMTTNRADLVDDAVASRCLARIDYAIPTTEDQKRIWATLADTAGVHLPYDEIKKIVARHPRLSGRDVKNLLKLGSMVAAVRGGKVTAEIVDFVKQFKPTSDGEK